MKNAHEALIQLSEINSTINTFVRLAERLNGTEDAENRLLPLFTAINGLTADAGRIAEDGLK